MKDLMRRCAPAVDESRWVVLRLGVDLPPARNDPPATNQPPVILLAARFSPEKGHATLLEAVGRLLEEGERFELWLAGSGPLRAEAERRAKELGVDHVVRFLGYVPNAEILRWLAAGRVDLVTLPSDSEGLPVSLIEALAHGVPAVASDVGGVAELLGGGCGVLVPPGDSRALAQGIGSLLRSPHLRERTARKGRARVEQEFAVERVVAHLRTLLGLK
jgi:glycosyltransferase involved in cell wall biosynthesis